jgi:hydrogenase maturation protease
MNANRGWTRLLVCGNVDRRDDGAAIWAVAAYLDEFGDDCRVEVRRCGQLDIEDLLDAAGQPLVIVDAAIGASPGTVVTIPLDSLLEQTSCPTPHSSHALPIGQVLGVARELANAPIDGVFVGVGGVDFGFGRSLSTEVRATLRDFSAAIASAINDQVGQPVYSSGGERDVS